MRQTTVLVLVLLFHHAFSQVHRSTIEKGDKKNNELFSSLNLWTIESKKLKESFDVIVKTPLGYSDTERSYPMLFVLDADATYGMASEIPTLLLFEGSVQRVIVVGVSYQSFNSWLSKRERDLTPSQDPKKPTSGQSLEFLSMIAIEIIPSIEDRYRVDSSNRILYGHSYGGLFGFFALFNSDNLFSSYILTSPSVDWDNESMARIEREFSKKGKDLKGKVYVSVGEKEDDIGVPLKSLVNSLKSRKYDGLELEFEEIDGESHMSSMAYAYTRGLKWVFSRSPKE